MTSIVTAVTERGSVVRSREIIRGNIVLCNEIASDILLYSFIDIAIVLWKLQTDDYMQGYCETIGELLDTANNIFKNFLLETNFSVHRKLFDESGLCTKEEIWQ